MSDESHARTEGTAESAESPHREADETTDRTGSDEAYVCTDCDERWFYARARCPECGGGDHATYELGVGTLCAVTTARVTPADVRDENPLGLAEFDGGVTVLAQLPTGEHRPGVGDAVELTGSSTLREGVRGARLHGVEDDAHPRAGRGHRREVHES